MIRSLLFKEIHFKKESLNLDPAITLLFVVVGLMLAAMGPLGGS